MTSYVDVFGGSPVQPSDLMYALIALDATNDGVQAAWPGFQLGAEPVIARVTDLSSDQTNRVLTMPSALQVSTGQDVLFSNVGAFTVLIDAADGTSLLSINPGERKYIYLADNTTEAGVWGIVGFGVGVSSADASALAGTGLLPVSGRLATAMPSQNVDATFTVQTTDRAKTFVFTGGAQTLTLPSAGVVGSQFFFGVRNSGTGTITVTRQGTDLLDGQVAIQVNPDESTLIFTNGLAWFTMGRGRSAEFNFTQLIKNVAGSSNVTLTTAETQNKLLTFVGALTGNIEVIFPAIVNVYYLFNDTSGAFTLTVKTLAGTGFVLPQGQRIIAFCDGVDIFAAQTAVPGSAILFSDGTQAAPAITFALDTSVGLFRFGSLTLGFVSNNVLIATMDPTTMQMDVPITFGNVPARDGTVAALGLGGGGGSDTELFFTQFFSGGL